MFLALTIGLVRAPLMALEGGSSLASRAYWLLLAIPARSSGQAFITAVETYAEASGAAAGRPRSRRD